MQEQIAKALVAASALALGCGGGGPGGVGGGAGEQCLPIMCLVPGAGATVVDAGTGARIADSSVTAAGSSCATGACACIPASPPDGTFYCQLPAAGEYALTAHATGYAPATATAVVQETRAAGGCNACLGAPPVSIALDAK